MGHLHVCSVGPTNNEIGVDTVSDRRRRAVVVEGRHLSGRCLLLMLIVRQLDALLGRAADRRRCGVLNKRRMQTSKLLGGALSGRRRRQSRRRAGEVWREDDRRRRVVVTGMGTSGSGSGSVAVECWIDGRIGRRMLFGGRRVAVIPCASC